VFEGPDAPPQLAAVEASLGWSPLSVFAQNGCLGNAGDFLVVPTSGRLSARTLGILGVGPRATAGPASVRTAAMKAADRLRRFESVSTAIHLMPGSPATLAHALVEGLVLGRYGFAHHLTRQPDKPSGGTTVLNFHCSSEDLEAVRAACKAGHIYGEATNLARDLVNSPPNETTPAALAAVAAEIATWSQALSVRVWDPEQLAEDGFGAILAVGSGARNSPRLIELSYNGSGDAPWHAIVGKGVTFDSGGLDIKAFDNMIWMKADMAGGAAALAAIGAAARLGLPVNAIAIVPAAENEPGPDAYRPGDIIRHRGGKTCEVISTDAEGRLILADALAYACERRPAALIDLATLTSAILGDETSAVFSTDARLLADLQAAGEEAAEPLWELPLLASCHKYIESIVADLKNLEGGLSCGTVVGAMYLREFTGDIPWAHIDIVGTAFHQRPIGPWPIGATGAGTRTIIGYLARQ
jgi:leucyl aminopeptidase